MILNSNSENENHPRDCPCKDCETKFEPPDQEEPPHY